MKDFSWKNTDRYLSNNGCGPYEARILCVIDDVATMERWLIKSGEKKHATRFELPVKFLQSDTCGWSLKP